MADLDLDKLEGLLKAADEERNGPRSESIFPARLEYATALHNAAPELIAAARKLEALQGGVVVPLATLKWLYGEVPHPRTGLWLERPLSGGAYWWRSVLRKDIALATAKEGKS